MKQSTTPFAHIVNPGSKSARLVAPRNTSCAAMNLNNADTDEDDRKDYFKSEHGLAFAGTHLILDLWDADQLDNLPLIEDTLRACVTAAGATLLHIHLHHFEPNGGVSGVAVLAESHISIHSWPERRYAALDVFMCGDAQPHKCIAVLQQAFGPACRVTVAEHKRGMTVA